MSDEWVFANDHIDELIADEDGIVCFDPDCACDTSKRNLEIIKEKGWVIKLPPELGKDGTIKTVARYWNAPGPPP